MSGAAGNWSAECESWPLRVFISYRREDTADSAGRLYDALVARCGKGRVFLDVGSIDPGVNFAGAVAEALASCDVLLAVIGRQWLTVTDARGRPRLEDPDDLVRFELTTALANGIRVIPVLVQGARMPTSDQLHDGVKALARRNALEMTPAHWNCDLQRLTAALNKLQRQAPAGAAPRPDGPAPPGAAIPRQLPAAVAGFAGRAAELKALTGLLEKASGQARTVVISAIDGTAGVGKTALAVQWAHHVASRFPGGQLYVNLRGFDPVRTCPLAGSLAPF
jgi:hypothetical protein